MHFAYIDDSADERVGVLTAMLIPAESWKSNFAAIRAYRKALRASDGIFVQKELHAWEFVSGRGRIADRVVTKGRRCELFRETLRLVTSLDGVRIINVVYPKTHAYLSKRDLTRRGYERLLTRIHMLMQKEESHAVLVCDAGDELQVTAIARKLAVYNPIKSRFGQWGDTGKATKNMTTDRILEDPFFKSSDRSYFIQLVDFCAYSLLRKERPLASKAAYGLHEAFFLLDPVLERRANTADPFGIVRV